MVAGRLRRRATFQEAVMIRDPDGMLIQEIGRAHV